MTEPIAVSPLEPSPSRRTFLVTSLSAGFALAARPAYASRIATPDEGLDVGEISVPVEGGAIPGYQARPKGGTNLPVVLVVQEIFGLHEHIRDVCRRFAQQGFLAVSCELYARQGDVTKLEGIEAILEVVKQVPDAQVMSDLDALASWAGSHGGDTTRMGVTGFCWGGRIVWLYAAHREGLKAGVAWYGRLAGDPDPLHPKRALDLVSELEAPVLGLYGANDHGIPVRDVEAMRAALKSAGKEGELVVYPGAPHGFHADYRASYTPEAAKDSFARALAWLRTHGVA